MSRLFSTAIAGMQAHALGIEVHASNVANINTTGYKSQRPTFKTLFSQGLRGARGGSGNQSGIDPQQVGAGVRLSTTNTDFNQGSLEHTGQNLDLAIMGRGFFSLRNAEGAEFFTRDGQLTMDSTGRLTHAASGLAVQGLLVDSATGTIPASAIPEDIVIPPGLSLNARATSKATIAGNLDAATTTAGTAQMQWRYHDSLGVPHIMTITFTRAAAASTWDWTATVGSGPTTVGTGQIVFNAVGDVLTGGTGNVSVAAASGGLSPGASDPQSIAIDFTTMTQFAAPHEVQATFEDGFPPGSLTDVTTDEFGNVAAVFSNGQTRDLAKLAIVNFANIAGLTRKADNLFQQSANTGSPQVVSAGHAGVGTIQSQSLERANVDLGNELTQLIVLQRGYQAATRLISTADEMLQEALGLKR